MPHPSIRELIQKVATGAEMSRSISRDEACQGMRLVLEQSIPDVQAAVFLIGLRMKRETDEELAGMLDALLEQVKPVDINSETLIDMADIYNGYARYLPITPFLPPLLAACGLPTICHSIQDLGPKHGLTLHGVYKKMGMDVNHSPEQAAQYLQTHGWAYIDQSQYSPALHGLLQLRNLVVKRTGIHTLEGLCRPLRSSGKNHLLTGYVHTNYLRSYTQLAKQAGFHSALVVRGIEGGAVALPTKITTCAMMDAEQNHHNTYSIDPTDCDLKQRIELERFSQTKTEPTQQTIEWGTNALKGLDSPFRDPLIYTGALVLKHLNRVNCLQDAANSIRKILDQGIAYDLLIPSHNRSSS